ncbi:MAG: glycosyl hydrolase family 88 [Oscillospiraceae bacterium]
MADFSNRLYEKLELIRESYRGFFENAGESEYGFAAFVSVCNTTERATVLRGNGDTPEAAWESACRSAMKFVQHGDFLPAWVKADITAAVERVSFTGLMEQVTRSRNEFFRRGISFDDRLQKALIEAEINGNRLITYKQHTIELKRVNRYLAQNGVNTLKEFPENVLLFDCESRFCGEDNVVHTLYGYGEPDRNNYGRRVISGMDEKLALEVISTSSEYLSMQVAMNGRFDYGYYPIFHKEIPGYNIQRHASSIWSLICAYRLTGDRFTLGQIQKAIGFMVRETFKKYPDRPGQDNTVFLADRMLNEVKLGGNAVAIIMLTEFMDATGTDTYTKLVRELGNGILELFDQRDGSFFHVLNFPELSPKDKYRTVYYDGEAAFALSRLYALTREQKWLDAASLAVDRFIREGYEKYRDHWVAYAVNELTKYRPEDKYLCFGLKNANVNLDRIYRQDTTYHTYLELLTVTFELYSRIKEQGLECSYLEQFNTKKFVDAIYRRAEYMLNGYGYPEYVMYLKYPNQLLGAFFVRHDGYRIRIDDIQHFCGAYYSFYRNYDKLSQLRDSFER